MFDPSSNPAAFAQADNKKALEKTIKTMVNSLYPVDENIGAYIKELQELNVKMVAITALPPAVADAIIKRLKELGLNFSQTSLSNEEIPLMINGATRARYKAGIVFAGAEEYLDAALASLFKQLNYQPQSVIIIGNIAQEEAA